MAKLEYRGFEINITPRWEGNWWEIDFEFLFKGKQIFNPEIFHSMVFTGDVYHLDSFNLFFKKLTQQHEKKECFGWGAWEEEVQIIAEQYAHSGWERIEEGKPEGRDYYIPFYELTFLIHPRFLKDGWMDYGYTVPAIRIYPTNEEMKKFYAELDAEMDNIEGKNRKRFKYLRSLEKDDGMEVKEEKSKLKSVLKNIIGL